MKKRFGLWLFVTMCLLWANALPQTVHAQGSVSYRVEQVTTDETDHRWPAVNDNLDIVWCQKVGAKWQVFLNGTQVTFSAYNCMFPAVSNSRQIIYFEDRGSGGVGWRVVRYPDNAIIEFSSLNTQNGAHRDAGMHPGIASDGTTISFYDFFNPSPPPTRRFNVSGVGRLGDNTGGAIDFYPGDFPDINASEQLVYSYNGQTYKMSVNDRSGTSVLLGDIPRINDAGNIVAISAAHVKVFLAPDYTRKREVHTGVWSDLNNRNEVVFEDFVKGRRQIFKATPQRTVLLVHGTWSNHLEPWQEMNPALTRDGYRVETVDYNLEPETRSNETGPRLQARALSRKIRTLLTDDPDGDIDVVAHSLGGLGARWYLHDSSLWPQSDHAGVDRLVLIGTPNWGTDLELVSPILAVAIAHNYGAAAAVEAGGGSYPSDTIDNWASGLRDMFGEWMPPPVASGIIFETYSYPADYKMARWPQAFITFGPFITPIEARTRVIGFALASGAAILYGDTAALGAFNDANDRFGFRAPARSLLRKHRGYYNVQASLMGESLYPNVPPDQVMLGVNTRRISRFLYELNSSPDASGAHIYIIAGRSPVLSPPVPILLAPFTIDNDGIVPYLSALGIEPINRTPLFAASTDASMQLTLDSKNHTQLPHDSSAINKVLQWLHRD